MKKFHFLLIFLFISTFSFGQILKPVTWTTEIKSLGNNEYDLVFKGKIQKGWSTYSQTSSDDGPIPTTVNFDEGSHYEKLGETREIGKKKEAKEPLFDNVMVAKYSKNVDFVQKIKILDRSKTITGYLNYMACNDRTCTPPTDFDFVFSIPQDKPTSDDQGSAPQKEISKNVVLEKKEAVEVKEVDVQSEKVINDVVLKKAESQADDKEKAESKILKPVVWSFSSDDLGNGEVEIQMTADIESGWTVYSQDIEEDGPIPTSFIFEEGDHFNLVGETVESSEYKVEGYDKFFDMDVVKYKKKVVFSQKIKVVDAAQPIIGSLEFMACDDTKCLPPEVVDFAIDPESGEETADAIQVNITDGNKIEQGIPIIMSSYKNPLGECEGDEEVSESTSYWSIFLGGFIGGLVAILLPCIFPMIPITVSFFTKDNNKKGWVNGLIYGLSIIVIFVSIGLAVTALLGPEALNKLSTDWLANTIFFLIFVAFAISFFGYFEITLPSSWSTKSDQMADKGGLLGTFFMAATLAIVSFSCTGPIIGTALVQVASTGSYMGPFFIMFGFSLALAIPFGFFAAFPTWLNSLPRSGSWMNSVKVVLGFLELALALKFLSVADMTSHWGVLRYELFLGLWVLIFAGMTAYLLGYIRFPHDSPNTKIGLTRGSFAALSLVATIYLAMGFMYDSETQTYDTPGLTSGITPPATYNFFLTPPELDQDIKSRYPSYTLCANNIPCFKDYYEGIAYSNEVNRPMLVDFTGYGCVNCRKTEEHIWVDKVVRKRLINDYILVSLYVDDRNKLEKTLISDRGDEGLKKLRTVGSKWADFQIKNFEQNSQPLYVLMNSKGEVLVQPRGYREGIRVYSDFLECGLDINNRLNGEG